MSLTLEIIPTVYQLFTTLPLTPFLYYSILNMLTTIYINKIAPVDIVWPKT